GPTTRSGPARRTTPDSGRRRSPTLRADYEIVASTRCPSLWPNLILEKSHSSTTTGHFAATTHPRPIPHRCIQAKGRSAVLAKDDKPGPLIGRLRVHREHPIDRRSADSDRGGDGARRFAVAVHRAGEVGLRLAAGVA